MEEATSNNPLERELDSLRSENARLRTTLEEICQKLTEPAEVIRAIQQGEIDALVVHEDGQEEIYSLQKFDSIYRTVVEECFPYGVWLAELDGTLLYVSPTFLNLLGRTLDEMQQKGQFHFLQQEIRTGIDQQWEKSRETQSLFSVEYTVHLADGTDKTIWTQGLIARTHDGHPRWVGVNIDVTKQKEIQEELRESDRRKDEFLATLAHELRNPLAPICAGMDLLRLAGDNSAIVDEARNTIDGQVKQLVRLVDDLMDLSRITSGRVILRKEPVELALIVQRAVDAARPLITESGHELSVILPSEPVYLEADPIRMAQVLSNLLNNAAKYTEKGGHIRIISERQTEDVLITVQDDGIGIPEEMQHRIFEMFAQVDRSLERSQSGLGIGLTLVKRLVEMHNGSIAVHSDGPGRGSQFLVRIPILTEVSTDSPPITTEGTGPAGRLRILVVDDSKAAAKMLSLMLQTQGDEVRIAHDGLEAVQIAEEFHPDLVLMDIGMPQLNGYDAARRIRKQPWGQNTVLVALTGWGQDEDRKQAREAGFDRHYIKPVDHEVLWQLLADLRRESH